MADSDARDLLISMPSLGFNRGQNRNATVVVGNAIYLAKHGVMRRQLEPVESHFGACALRNTPSTIAQIKVFLQKKRKRFRALFLALLAKWIRENRQDGGKEGRISDLFKL